MKTACQMLPSTAASAYTTFAVGAECLCKEGENSELRAFTYHSANLIFGGDGCYRDIPTDKTYIVHTVGGLA